MCPIAANPIHSYHYSPLTSKVLLELTGGLSLNDTDKTLLEDFIRDTGLLNRADATLKCYCDRLIFLARWAAYKHWNLRDITKRDLQRYMFDLKNEGSLSISTINGRIRVFRRFFNWVEEEEVWHGWANPVLGIKLLPGESTVKEIFRHDQLNMILASFSRPGFYDCRNKTMIMLLYDGMLRVGELLGLEVGDVVLSEKAIILRKTKNHKQAVLPLSSKTARQLHLYMRKYRRKIEGKTVFCQKNGESLSYNGMVSLLKRKQRLLGFKINCHKFRHTGATHYIEAGGSIEVLSASFLRHSDIQLAYKTYVHMTGVRARRDQDKFSPLSNLNSAQNCSIAGSFKWR